MAASYNLVSLSAQTASTSSPTKQRHHSYPVPDPTTCFPHYQTQCCGASSQHCLAEPAFQSSVWSSLKVPFQPWNDSPSALSKPQLSPVVGTFTLDRPRFYAFHQTGHSPAMSKHSVSGGANSTNFSHSSIGSPFCVLSQFGKSPRSHHSNSPQLDSISPSSTVPPASPQRHKHSTWNGSNKSAKSDVLLDRKAFISLEKSINWHTLLNTTPNDSSSGASSKSNSHNNSNDSSPVDTVSHELHKTTTDVKSESPIDADADQQFSQPGMKDVPCWLKLLRLHKYAPIFAHMSYDEMLNLTEQDLETRNITKGARQKLILSIQKLKARSAVLMVSECKLVDHDRRQYRSKISYATLSQSLVQIRAFLSTPIRPYACDSVFGSGLSKNNLSPSSSSSSSLSSSGHSSSPSSPHSSTVSLSPPVDFNNNSSSNTGSNSFHSPSSSLLDFKDLVRCWAAFSSDHLPDIITRLIGHVHNILVRKCKKRLKKLNLWQEYFKNIYDKLFASNLCFRLNELQDYDHFVANQEVFNFPTFSDRDGHGKDEEMSAIPYDSSLLQENKANLVSLADKDSGLDDDGSEDSCEKSDILTLEQEDELYTMLVNIVNKCLLHEAFIQHHVLFLHWREQLQYMINALRYVANGSNVPAKSQSSSDQHNHHHHHHQQQQQQQQHQHQLRHSSVHSGICKSSINQANQSSCHMSGNVTLSKRKTATFSSSRSAAITANNYSKGPNTSSWTSNNFSNQFSGRRPFGNKLSEADKSGKSHHDKRSSNLKIGSNPKCDQQPFGSVSFNSNGSTNNYLHQAPPLQSNLSVIPQTSDLFTSAISMNYGTYATSDAFPSVTNSPEANLRNMLQHLLATHKNNLRQQPHHHYQSNGNANTCASLSHSSHFSCPISPIQSSSSSLSTTNKYNLSLPSIETIQPSNSNQNSSLDDSFPFSSLDTVSNSFKFDDSPNKWGLNDHSNNIDADIGTDWSSVDLLSTFKLKLKKSLTSDDTFSWCNSRLDKLKNSKPFGGASSETATYDDIEQLSIRIAEHALEINDDTIHS